MLDNAKVQLSLRDFDELRNDSKQLEELKSEIAKITDVKYPDDENKNIALHMNLEKLLALAVDYSCYRKHDEIDPDGPLDIVLEGTEVHYYNMEDKKLK